ncbi:MAG: inorganic phosphate transporter [Chloroflexales bacterium]|nr:inorganic phosphate transporter [Chloroflexales bacterium]
MLYPIPDVVIALIVLALTFGFLNGFHDSSSIVATMISSRAMSPRYALLITAIAEAIGPFLFGVAVARTIVGCIVAENAATMPLILAALLGAIVWGIVTWLFGIPSSSSQALIGGLIGATLTGFGLDALKLAGLGKIMLALFISPLLGLLVGHMLMKLVFVLASGATPRINSFLKRGQILTALTLALVHSANDAQKTMGIITLGLVATGVLPSFAVPIWVIALSAGALALGTLCGGSRLIRTVGRKFFTIRPVHGFTTHISSTTVILSAALVGAPISTTQVVASSILGVGSAERLKKVRWGAVYRIGIAWVLTIPMSALLAAAMYVIVGAVL